MAMLHSRSPPSASDEVSAIPAVESTPEMRRSPLVQNSPERRRCDPQQEYKELAVALDRHASRARALAEELACRRASDDLRPLLAPLVSFQTSLLDMHHGVLDAISEVASSVGNRGSPSCTKCEDSSFSSSPLHVAEPSTSSTQPAGHDTRDLDHVDVVPTSMSHPSSVAVATDFQQSTALAEVIAANRSDSPVTRAIKETPFSTFMDLDKPKVAASLFFGGTAKQSGRTELLHFVGNLLRRKRDLLLSEGNGHLTEKVREVEQDLARVELELVMRSPADTPQKRRVEANTSVAEVLATEGKTPSQGSTATPPTRSAIHRQAASPSSRTVPSSGANGVGSSGSGVVEKNLCRSSSPTDRNCKSELDFSDTPQPVVHSLSRAYGPEMHDEPSFDKEELDSNGDSMLTVRCNASNTPLNVDESHETSFDRDPGNEASQQLSSNVEAEGAEVVSPLPEEIENDSTAKLDLEGGTQSNNNEFLIRQCDIADAVLIGSARHVGGDRSSPEHREHSARKNSSDQAESQCDVSPREGVGRQDKPERLERSSWRWGGDIGHFHGTRPSEPETSSPHSSDSPVLPSASEVLYDDSHLTSMNNVIESSTPVVPSRRSPLRTLPPPWAFQCDTSVVIPGTTSATTLVGAPGGQIVAETHHAGCRGKENVTPPAPMAPSQISSASSSVPIAKPPPKAPPTAFDTVASLTRSSSTPGKRLPTTSIGASAGLFHKTPSPRPRSRQRTSPGSAPAGSLVLQPRSLLFGSPSPHKCVGNMDQETLDWMSPIRPLRPVRPCREAQPDLGGNNGIEPSESSQIMLPLPLPVTGLSEGDWRPSAKSPVRVAVATPGNQVAPARASGSPGNRSLADSPAPVGSSPAKVNGSPARVLGSSPARTTTPVRAYLRSPSAHSVVGSPASSCGARDSGGQRQQRSGGTPLGSGETPRNLTDWRKSLQMAKRQEERPSHKKTPWK